MRRGSWGRNERIRAGRSVCSVKLSLRGSSAANLWDTYNASQEYCSSCRPFYPFSAHFSFNQPASRIRGRISPAREVSPVREDCSPSSDIEMYLAKKERISAWHGQPFCRRHSSPPSHRLRGWHGCRHGEQVTSSPVAELSAGAYNVEKRMTAGDTDWKEMKTRAPRFHEQPHIFRSCVPVRHAILK